jgi:hypothetical protein
MIESIKCRINDRVASMMQGAQCYTLPHNCKKYHCTDIKMWLQ